MLLPCDSPREFVEVDVSSKLNENTERFLEVGRLKVRISKRLGHPYDLWLDAKVQAPEAVLPLLTSAPEDASTLVNVPRNEGADCIARYFE